MTFPTLNKSSAKPKAAGKRQAYFAGADQVSCPVYRREDLGAGADFVGPALVQEHGTTTVLFAGDRCRMAESGELIIAIGGQK